MCPIGASIALVGLKESPIVSGPRSVASFLARASVDNASSCFMVGLENLNGELEWFSLVVFCDLNTVHFGKRDRRGLGRESLVPGITCRHCGAYGREMVIRPIYRGVFVYWQRRVRTDNVEGVHLLV